MREAEFVLGRIIHPHQAEPKEAVQAAGAILMAVAAACIGLAAARIGLRQPSHSLRHQVSESQQGDPGTR